jgi:hypothetical protein
MNKTSIKLEVTISEKLKLKVKILNELVEQFEKDLNEIKKL